MRVERRVRKGTKSSSLGSSTIASESSSETGMLSAEFTVSGLAVSDLLARSLLFSFSVWGTPPFRDRPSAGNAASSAFSPVLSLSELFPSAFHSSAFFSCAGSEGRAAILLSGLSSTSASPGSPSLCTGELFLGAFNLVFFDCLRLSCGGAIGGLEGCAVVSSVAGALLRSPESGAGCSGDSGPLSSDSAGIAAAPSSFRSPELVFGAPSPSFCVSGTRASLEPALNLSSVGAQDPSCMDGCPKYRLRGQEGRGFWLDLKCKLIRLSRRPLKK